MHKQAGTSVLHFQVPVYFQVLSYCDPSCAQLPLPYWPVLPFSPCITQNSPFLFSPSPT